jgi:predicted RecB family nuclease
VRIRNEPTLGSIMRNYLHETSMAKFKNVKEYCCYLTKMFKRLKRLGARLILQDEIEITTHGLSDIFTHFMQHCIIPPDGIKTKQLHELLDKYEEAHLKGLGLYEENCPLCKHEKKIGKLTEKEFLDRLNHGMIFKLYIC